MPTKKEIKQAIHDNGFFLSFPIEANSATLSNKYKSEASNIPADSFGWGGVASQEVINMNGYGIRLKAWKPAINNYLSNNPIIFFGHDDKQALGQTLSAKVTNDALEVFGYVRRQADQQFTAGSIEAGIYRMLSTGHVTDDFEFENEKTSEVMSKKDFHDKLNKEGYGEWLENWYMWVTKLRFLEWSIVGIGAVQGAYKSNTSEDIWLNHFHINKEDIMPKHYIAVNSDEPENAGETPVVVEEQPTEQTENVEQVAVEPTAEEAEDTTEAQPEPEAQAEAEGESEIVEETPIESPETPAEPEATEVAPPVVESEANSLSIQMGYDVNEVRRIAILAGKEVIELKRRLNSLEARWNSVASKKAIQTRHEVNRPAGEKTLADLLNI